MSKVHRDEQWQVENPRASLYKPGKNRCYQCGFRVRSVRHTDGIHHKHKVRKGK